MIDLSVRIDEPEILDTLECGEEEMLKALRFHRMTNRYSGGNAVILGRLKKYSASWPKNQAIRILDVGAGLADIDLKMRDGAKGAGHRVEITALELVPQIANLAGRASGRFENLKILQGDIFSHPFEKGSFDYATTSLFLHHMPQERLKPLLLKLDEISSRGLILSDLNRSLAVYGAVTLLTRLAGDCISRHDGPLSVRRAFRPEELQRLADEAGLKYLQAKREPFFRLSLAGGK